MIYAQRLLEAYAKETAQPFDVDLYDHLFVHTGSKKILDGILSTIPNPKTLEKSGLSYEI